MLSYVDAHRAMSENPLPPTASARGSVDLMVAFALVVVAAAAALALPEGSTGRLILGALGLFAPGYLLIQVGMVPVRPSGERIVHAVVSLAVGPAMVGLTALVAGLVPGSFRPTVIVGLIVLASALCTAGAWYRRSPMAARRREALRALRAQKRAPGVESAPPAVGDVNGLAPPMQTLPGARR